MWFTLDSFYNSKEWREFRECLIGKRFERDKAIIDEFSGQPILESIDIILHHKIPLTLGNVNDFEISLNEENIMIVSRKSHNIIHERMGYGTRHKYLVYGASSKKCLEYVRENACVGDTICHIPSIREMITIGDSQRTNSLVFGIRSLVLDAIKYNQTKSSNCWIIGQFPYSGERERYCKEYGCEPILIQTTLEEAVELDGEQNRKYIEEWFEIQRS